MTLTRSNAMENNSDKTIDSTAQRSTAQHSTAQLDFSRSPVRLGSISAGALQCRDGPGGCMAGRGQR